MTEKSVLERACELVGLGGDVRLFSRRARFAGWPEQRIAEELGLPNVKERFAAAVELGVAADLRRRVDRYMRDALIDGPRALALLDVDQLANLVSPQLRHEATAYDPFKTGGRLVCGPSGIGKSVAGIAVMRRLHPLKPSNMNDLWDNPEAETGPSSLWARAFGLANARLESKLGDGEASAVRSAIAANFLVLDDMGWESKRAGADDVIAEVIAARYDAGRITYATTGISYSAFVDRYGSAVVRRIVESGGLKGKVVDVWPGASK